MNGAAEWVVLVDDANRDIGVARKDEIHHAATPLHRAFSLFLFDGAGRMLLQRRALTKRTWPGVWSNACCGHPAPGEATRAAVVRRCREELGVDPLCVEEILPAFRYRAELDGIVENEICPVWVGSTGDVAPSPDPREVAELRWLGWHAFLAELPGDYSPWSVDEARQLAAAPAFERWRGERTALPSA